MNMSRCIETGYAHSTAYRKGCRCSLCKEWNRVSRLEYRQNNREKVRAYQRQWQRNNPNKGRSRTPTRRRHHAIKGARERARVRGLPCSLTYKNVPLPPNTCPVLGVKLEVGNNNDNSATLDRLIPALGYTPDNVVWMSRRANMIKSSTVPENLEDIYTVANWLAAEYEKRGLNPSQSADSDHET